MYKPPKGWTNQGQKRGCFALHPASDQARLVALQDQNNALTSVVNAMAERLGALEDAATTPMKSKKKGA